MNTTRSASGTRAQTKRTRAQPKCETKRVHNNGNSKQSFLGQEKSLKMPLLLRLRLRCVRRLRCCCCCCAAATTAVATADAAAAKAVKNIFPLDVAASCAAGLISASVYSRVCVGVCMCVCELVCEGAMGCWVGGWRCRLCALQLSRTLFICGVFLFACVLRFRRFFLLHIPTRKIHRAGCDDVGIKTPATHFVAHKLKSLRPVCVLCPVCAVYTVNLV